MNKLTERWLKTGLLEGVEGDDRLDSLSGFLNEISLDLISKEPKEGTPEHVRIEHIAGMVIPLGRRLFDKLYPNLPSPKVLVEHFSTYFDSNQDLFNDLKDAGHIALDYEQEFLEHYLNSYE